MIQNPISKQEITAQPTLPYAQSRRNFITTVAAGLGAVIAGNPLNLQAASRSNMDTHLSRRELELADIIGYRIIEPDRDLSKNSPSNFGRSVQLITPTAEMADLYNLGSDYASKRLAWIGAPTYSPSRQKSDMQGGAIALVDLESGKYHAVIETPLENCFKQFGSGFKLSPSGRYLGIEAKFGFAHILDQHTGKLTTLEHENFGNYAKFNGIFQRDLKGIGSEVDNGCTLEFIDDNTLVVSGMLCQYSGSDKAAVTGGIRTITFERFDVSGNHLGSMSKLYDDVKTPFKDRIYTIDSGECGAFLKFKDGYLYYASDNMYDPAYLEARSSIDKNHVHRGRIGAFNVQDSFKDLGISAYGSDPTSAVQKNTFGISLATVGSYLLTSREANRAEFRKQPGSGSILIYSIEGGLPNLQREIEIGADLGLDVQIRSFTPNTDDIVIFPIVAISCAAGGECKTQLGVLNLKTQNYKILTGHPDLTTAAAISIAKDPNNSSRFFVGDPGYNQGEGRIIELDIKSTSLGIDDYRTPSDPGPSAGRELRG